MDDLRENAQVYADHLRETEQWQPYEIVQDLIDALPQWISVEDRLPEMGVYLVSRKENRYPTSRFFDGEKWVSSATITHYMPLPQPPEE